MFSLYGDVSKPQGRSHKIRGDRRLGRKVNDIEENLLESWEQMKLRVHRQDFAWQGEGLLLHVRQV